MTTDYNIFAKTFSKSRKNMKWAELEYFFSLLTQGSILDIGCGNGRLLEQYNEYFSDFPSEYVGIDMSDGLIHEAQKIFPDADFRVGNMLDISKILGNKKYKNIFLIASFHHLETLEERHDMMKSLYDTCEIGGRIYMTNWALSSEYNKEKYAKSEIAHSGNKYNSSDFNIKIGAHDRFYHSFHEDELSYLAEKSDFKIIENRLFDNERNIITILEK